MDLEPILAALAKLTDAINRAAAGPPVMNDRWPTCNALVRRVDGTYYRCIQPPSACQVMAHRDPWPQAVEALASEHPEPRAEPSGTLPVPPG